MKEPILIERGSRRLGLGICHKPPMVDCRVVAEENYQKLKSAHVLKEWLQDELKHCDNNSDLSHDFVEVLKQKIFL